MLQDAVTLANTVKVHDNIYQTVHSFALKAAFQFIVQHQEKFSHASLSAQFFLLRSTVPSLHRTEHQKEIRSILINALIHNS